MNILKNVKQSSLSIILLASSSIIYAADPLKGQQIYQSGITIDPATANISGGMGMDVKTFPCQSCHQQDGSGGFEGGVVVPAVTWQALTNRRTGTAYDANSLKKAITEGVSNQGNKLHPLMPHYQFSSRDFENLLSYLKLRESINEIGVTDNTLKIGVIVSQQAEFKGIVKQVKTIFTHYFQKINNEGGIHGRKIELVFEDPRQLSYDVLFYTALVATAQELKNTNLSKQTLDIPILFPLNQAPIDNMVVFQADFPDQLSSLLAYMKTKQDNNASIRVYLDKDNIGDSLKKRLKETEIKSENIDLVENNIVEAIHPRKFIFWFSKRESLSSLVKQLNSKENITIYSSIDIVGNELKTLMLPENVHLILSNPRGTPELDSKEYRDFKYFQKEYSLAAKHTEWQRIAYLATNLISHTLKKTGRKINRQKLSKAAMSINSLRVGVMPAISTHNSQYRPSQILEFNAKSRSLKSLSNWLSG